ncbi:Ig-like domain-containing protein [Massilistercora timonensis]|uniref:Ig-like domain-containing protein n=1 Tax=Massilistercora timonensis TaxID=2086584 RepID=UPI0032091662
MIRKRIIAWMKRGACISLAAVILSAAAVPSAGMLVFAQEDTAGVVASEEEAIAEEGKEENRKKDDAQQKEETESGMTAVKGKISQTLQAKTGDIYPDKFSLNESQQTLTEGDTFQLKADGFSANATNKELTWTTSDPKVATVDENGLVTAVGAGTAVITATCVGANAGQEGPATAQCTVKVVNKEGAFLYTTNAEGITVEGYTGAVMMLTVPDEIAGKPVTAVADGAFSDCKYIADLTLPDTITSVGENAFEQVTNLVARKGTKTADALETAGLEYLAKVTVTLTTEYYNRDGSLSDTKGGTSTYTRREGNKIDMGTAITSRGWIQEKKTVTGMTDTDPALYGVEGIAGEEDIVIKFVWREDNLGPEGKGDKIPDQYQMEASFEVKNGTWDDGTSDVVEKLVTLRDESGDPAAEGTIEADAPAVGQAPAEGYEAGSWSPDITEKMTIADEGTTFVYSYAEKGEVKPDPEEPEEDTPGEDNPGTDNPDKDTDKNKEDKDSADNQKSNGEVQTGDTSPVGAAAGLLLVSGGVIIGTEALRRRKND